MEARAGELRGFLAVNLTRGTCTGGDHPLDRSAVLQSIKDLFASPYVEPPGLYVLCFVGHAKKDGAIILDWGKSESLISIDTVLTLWMESSGCKAKGTRRVTIVCQPSWCVIVSDRLIDVGGYELQVICLCWSIRITRGSGFKQWRMILIRSHQNGIAFTSRHRVIRTNQSMTAISSNGSFDI